MTYTASLEIYRNSVETEETAPPKPDNPCTWRFPMLVAEGRNSAVVLPLVRYEEVIGHPPSEGEQRNARRRIRRCNFVNLDALLPRYQKLMLEYGEA